MTSEKNMARGDSKSPKTDNVKPDAKATKANGGGVKVSNGEKHANGAVTGHTDTLTNGTPVKVAANGEKHPNGTVSGHAGASANGASGKTLANKAQESHVTVTNGITSKGGSSKPHHAHKLSGEATPYKPSPAPISLLNVNSTADGPLVVSSDVLKDTPDAAKREKGKGKTVTQEPIGTRGVNLSPTRQRAVFTTDVGPNVKAPGGHYIQIANIPNNEIGRTLWALNEAYDWNTKLRGQAIQQLEDRSKFSTIHLCFDDVRDASRAFDQIYTIDTACDVHYNSQMEYANALREAGSDTSTVPTAFYDGQVIFMAQFDGLNDESNAESPFNEVEGLARSMGKVLAFDEVFSQPGVAHFRAEYCSIQAAKEVVAGINSSSPTWLEQWAVATKEMPSYDAAAVPDGNVHHLESSVTTPHRGNDTGVVAYTSPSGRTAWRVEENGKCVPIPGPNQLERVKPGQYDHGFNDTPEARVYSEPTPQTPVTSIVSYSQGRRYASWSGPYSQHAVTPYLGRRPTDIEGTPTSVEVANIMNGFDVRTTVMIRNLPNSLNLLDVKGILDRTSFGKYDFSYLRVDFGNNMNVGYGFVNFTDPAHIVDFVKFYVGRPWQPQLRFNRKKGPRLADVSYATIQGYDCLVEKFRNSAVMDEYVDFRPKLWWTKESAPHPNLIGQERPFPPSNNESKKQRSRDNAGAVGLFASGSRRNRNNNGGRHHQSQYDRGTPAQIQEDAYYTQSWPQISPLQPNYPYADPNYMHGAPPMAIGPPPQFSAPPQFHCMGFSNMNGFAPYPVPYANTMGVMDPMAYGYTQHADPFNDHYRHPPTTPGHAYTNGGFTGHVNRGQSPGNGYQGRANRGQNEGNGYQGRAYQNRTNGQQVPRAILEEDEQDNSSNGSPNTHTPPQ